MQYKIKSLKIFLALLVGALTMVMPVIIPFHAYMAFAQESNDYPDISQNHWVYIAMSKLSEVGLIEDMSNGVYLNYQPRTRYEFAVAVARILDKVGALPNSAQCDPGKDCMPGLSKTISDNSGFVKRPELIDAISALRTEFRNELDALGVRRGGLDKRVVPFSAKPPKLTVTPKTQGSEKSADDIGVVGKMRARISSHSNSAESRFIHAADLEATGVRAYLGQDPRLKSDEILQSAASIYGNECRHVSFIRYAGGTVFSPDGMEVPKTAAQVRKIVALFAA